MRTALAEHDEVLRRAIGEHLGYLFKHTGDGVCAAFASPKSAVDAAIAAQRELELPVRMGIATGEAELRDSDYFGTALNRAARLMSAGHGGQVLVADSTVRLLSGVELVDLGQHRLRDLAEPVGVFQVQAPGLPVEFPPLRTLSRRPGNICPPASSFIGREKELGKVSAAIRSQRLVTLTGVGGVGKTRLAVEVARRLAEEFPDGVWLVELAAVSDPDAVPDAFAAALGVTQQPGSTVAESVADAMEGKTHLLVVDNCEHLRDAAAEVTEAILSRSATVRVLATSREGLGLDDEHLWAVPSLEVHENGSAAVDLFVDRASTVVADFELVNADEEAAAVEICRRLDGIPLAIELAASRMASMTVLEVRDRLHQRFRLLVGSRRGLERHQTLRHTVAWSFDMLGPAEKELLQRCSVFAGGFDLAGAVAVAAPEAADEFEVLDALDALVRKSLLVPDRSSGRTRYSMLETIRQFAEDQLPLEESAALRSAHAAYFAGREADLEALWDSPRQREAYDWFRAEVPNLRTAFRWAADNAELDVAAAIATYAAFLGYALEYLEPFSWAEELLPSAHATANPRRAALLTLASECWMLGRIEDAVRFSDDAVRTISTAPTVQMPFGIEGLLGSGYLACGQPQRSVDCYRAVTRLGLGAVGNLLNRSGLAMALSAVGDVDAAVSTAEDLVSGLEPGRNGYVESIALLAYGIALALAKPELALDRVRRGLSVAQRTGNRAIETNLTSMVARIMVVHGEPIESLDNLTTAIRRLLDAGNLEILRNNLAILAGLFKRFDRDTAAARILGFAINPFVTMSMPEVDATVANLRESLGDSEYEALCLAGASMTLPEISEFVETEIANLRAELAAT